MCPVQLHLERFNILVLLKGCEDGTTTDLTQDVVRSVTLSLVPDDSEIDGHRECRILLRPQQGSMCIFNITRGSTQLRVMDDEGECSVTSIAIFTCCDPLSILSTEPIHHWLFKNQLQFSLIHHRFIRKNF